MEGGEDHRKHNFVGKDIYITKEKALLPQLILTVSNFAYCGYEVDTAFHFTIGCEFMAVNSTVPVISSFWSSSYLTYMYFSAASMA